MTCLTPWGILFFSQLQVQVAFVVGNLAQLQVDGVLFLRGKVNGGCALTENALVAALAPVQLVSVQVGEQVFVPYFDYAALGVNGFKIDILVQSFDFRQLWCFASVAEQQTVAAKVAVMRIFAEIAAVSQVFVTLRVSCQNALVNPVPDEAALEAGIFVPQGCVFVGGAAGVTHRVGEFAQNERTTVPAGDCVFLALLRTIVHF